MNLSAEDSKLLAQVLEIANLAENEFCALSAKQSANSGEAGSAYRQDTSGTSSLLNPLDFSELFHKVAHEIGNPLTSIISLSSILPFVSTDQQKLKEYCGSVTSEAWKINRLVDCLVILFSAREPNTVEFSSVDLVERTIKRISSRCATLNAEIVVLPGSENTVHADFEQSCFVLSELLINALESCEDFNNKQSADSKVALRATKVGGMATIDVWNCTYKLPPNLSDCFTPTFSQNKHNRCIGLGLSAAKTSVQRYASVIELSCYEFADKQIFRATLELPVKNSPSDAK